MWKLAASVVFVIVVCGLHGPVVVRAKGVGDLIIGGADLAPYYYAIQEPPPRDLSWLGLLGTPEGGVPALSPAPPDADVRLASSYELSFDGGITTGGAPSARYAPGAAGHAPYLYYEDEGHALPRGWYALSDEAARYLDRARAAVFRAKAGDGVGLETDPVAAFVLHGLYYTGQQGTPSIISDAYDMRESVTFTPGEAPQFRVTGADAEQMLRAYVATLHNWHPTSVENAGGYHDVGRATGRRQFTVFVAQDREVFSFVTGADSSALRVYAAEGFGGFFDPSPELTSLIRRIIPAQKQTGGPPSVTRAQEASRSAGIVAGALAAGLLLALGIGAVWSRWAARAATL